MGHTLQRYHNPEHITLSSYHHWSAILHPHTLNQPTHLPSHPHTPHTPTPPHPHSLPPSSPSSPGAVRRPPQAWSKIHQKIQPTHNPRGRQTSDDPHSSAGLLPLPDHLLPITSSTPSHLHTPPTVVTETNHSAPQPYQSLPKVANGTKPSSKAHGKSPVSAMATQHGVRRSTEVVAMETQGRRGPGRGGAPLLGSAPPSFPATNKDSKPSQARPQKVVYVQLHWLFSLIWTPMRQKCPC